MYDVTALGELLIDFSLVSTDHDGYPTLKGNPGGAPCNYLAALTRYGSKTALIGKVGDDPYGQMLIKTAISAGIETRGIKSDPDVFTTLSFVTLDKDGDRSCSFARKPGADTCLRWEDVDLTLIDDCRYFHFGTLSLTDNPSREATGMAVSYAKTAGKFITFDPNLRMTLWKSGEDAKSAALWGISQADIIKISDEEVDFLFGCGPEDGARRIMEKSDASLVMVTLGPNGCYMKSVLSSCHIPAPSVNSVDTTGAGDIFFGVAMSLFIRMEKNPSLLDVSDLSEMGRIACTAASLSTEKSGAIPSIPDESIVREYISSRRLG